MLAEQQILPDLVIQHLITQKHNSSMQLSTSIKSKFTNQAQLKSKSNQTTSKSNRTSTITKLKTKQATKRKTTTKKERIS